jgi:hypothetical protein
MLALASLPALRTALEAAMTRHPACANAFDYREFHMDALGLMLFPHNFAYWIVTHLDLPHVSGGQAQVAYATLIYKANSCEDANLIYAFKQTLAQQLDGLFPKWDANVAELTKKAKPDEGSSISKRRDFEDLLGKWFEKELWAFLPILGGLLGVEHYFRNRTRDWSEKFATSMRHLERQIAADNWPGLPKEGQRSNWFLINLRSQGPTRIASTDTVTVVQRAMAPVGGAPYPTLPPVGAMPSTVPALPPQQPPPAMPPAAQPPASQPPATERTNYLVPQLLENGTIVWMSLTQNDMAAVSAMASGGGGLPPLHQMAASRLPSVRQPSHAEEDVAAPRPPVAPLPPHPGQRVPQDLVDIVQGSFTRRAVPPRAQSATRSRSATPQRGRKLPPRPLPSDLETLNPPAIARTAKRTREEEPQDGQAASGAPIVTVMLPPAATAAPATTTDTTS